MRLCAEIYGHTKVLSKWVELGTRVKWFSSDLSYPSLVQQRHSKLTPSSPTAISQKNQNPYSPHRLSHTLLCSPSDLYDEPRRGAPVTLDEGLSVQEVAEVEQSVWV